MEAAPAPRLSRTPGQPGEPAGVKDCGTDAVLAAAGFTAPEIAGLRRSGALGGSCR